MKEVVKIIELDRPEQGVMFTALNDLHKKRVAAGKSTDTVVSLIKELYSAPTKKRKVRSGDAR